MFSTQTPAPSVGSKIILDIGPRLRIDLVEVGKNEEARTSPCLAVDAARPSHRGELFRSGNVTISGILGIPLVNLTGCEICFVFWLL
jgi:hypothetical protein